jgi:hypothetical protein
MENKNLLITTTLKKIITSLVESEPITNNGLNPRAMGIHHSIIGLG